MTNYERIIDDIIRVEGDEYTDHPSDNGGPTKFGITQATARANGYSGDMRELPEPVAREIYRKRYVITPWFDRVALVDPSIGYELIDTGVNCGVTRASEFFQRALNVFNAKGSRYADVLVDGRIGPVTIEALRAFLRWRGAKGTVVMLRALNALQGYHYIALAERDQRQEDFTFGWFDNRVS